MAVIEAGEAKIELLGDVSGTTAGKIDILEVGLDDGQGRVCGIVLRGHS